jgi:hypothetical protein
VHLFFGGQTYAAPIVDDVGDGCRRDVRHLSYISNRDAVGPGCSKSFHDQVGIQIRRSRSRSQPTLLRSFSYSSLELYPRFYNCFIQPFRTIAGECATLTIQNCLAEQGRGCEVLETRFA